MKKILFVNDEMTMGGVSRILNTLLKNLDKDKYDIDLLVLHKRGELLKDVPDYVNIISGSAFFKTVDIPLKSCDLSNIFSKLRLIFYMKTGLIKKRIKKERKKLLNKHYDIEFSAKEGFCSIFVALGDSDIKLNWVQVDYKVNNYAANHMGLMKEILKEIDMNIASSKVVSKSFKEIFEVSNVITIHNLMDEKMIKEKAKEEVDFDYDNNKINLICVARFHYQKGLDILLKAYREVKDNYRLTIIGDGELRDELFDLAKELDIDKEVSFLGIKENPYPFIRKSDLFIMTSRYEGFATIVLESLMSETPVLAMKVAGIDEEIIEDYHGFIIENDFAVLVKTLKDLSNSKALLLEYKKKLKDYHYDNEAILERLNNIFEGKYD